MSVPYVKSIKQTLENFLHVHCFVFIPLQRGLFPGYGVFLESRIPNPDDHVERMEEQPLFHGRRFVAVGQPIRFVPESQVVLDDRTLLRPGNLIDLMQNYEELRIHPDPPLRPRSIFGCAELLVPVFFHVFRRASICAFKEIRVFRVLRGCRGLRWFRRDCLALHPANRCASLQTQVQFR